jgi:hypothetical protein
MVAVLGAAMLVSSTQGFVVPLAGGSGWFLEMGPSAQDDFMLGFQHGMYGMGGALSEWLMLHRKELSTKARQQLEVLAYSGDWAVGAVDLDDLRFMVTYPDGGGEWQVAVVRELMKQVMAYMKENPDAGK